MSPRFRLRRRLVNAMRDERGSASASIAFVIIAAVICGALAAIASNVVLTTSGTQQLAFAESAINTRYVDYLTAAATSPAAPSLDETCYAQLRTCVAITAVDDGATAQTITLHARSQSGGEGMTRVRVLPHGVSHIAGFDVDGNPVWTRIDGAAEFPGSWNAPRQP